MVVAALLAGLLNYDLLRSRDRSVPVAIAAEALTPGQTVSASSFATTAVRVDPEVLATLLAPGAVGQVEGWVSAAPVAQGDLVRVSDLRAPAAAAGERAMSLPVDPAHAAGGALAAGDRIDVIAVGPSSASYVLVDTPVLATGGGAPSALAASGSFTITLSVDDAEALRLAAAIQSGGLEVVRVTGASPAQLGASVPATAERPTLQEGAG